MALKFLHHWPAGTAFVLLTGLLLMACYDANIHSTDNSGAVLLQKGKKDSICKVIYLTDLRKSIAASKKGSVILGIYPLKRSANMKKKDFDLALVVLDTLKVPDIQGKGKGKAQAPFLKEYNWYRSYLKNKNIPEASIPIGYYLEANVQTLNKENYLKLCIAVVPDRNAYSARMNSMQPCFTDSCKSPPGPCYCDNVEAYIRILKKNEE